MKNIRDLRATQIYLFPAGAVPMEALLAASGQEALRQSFGFREPPVTPWPIEVGPPPEIRFINGEFAGNEAACAVPSLVFQPRRILLTVRGTSAQADEVFARVAEVLVELAPDCAEDLSSVVYKAEETSCAVTLDLDFRKVFSRRVIKFLTGRVREAASKPRIPARVDPTKFTATISFDVRDAKITQHGIRLVPKELTIEPRPGTPLADRVFITRSPFRSDVHLALVQEFESLFK